MFEWEEIPDLLRFFGGGVVGLFVACALLLTPPARGWYEPLYIAWGGGWALLGMLAGFGLDVWLERRREL